jgi:hypothetical protein
MTTPNVRRFIELLRQLEMFATQYPELLEPSGKTATCDLLLLLEYVQTHATARAEILDHLYSRGYGR